MVIYNCILFLNYFMCLVSLMGSIRSWREETMSYISCASQCNSGQIQVIGTLEPVVGLSWIEDIYRPHLFSVLDYCAIHSFPMISSISIICPVRFVYLWGIKGRLFTWDPGIWGLLWTPIQCSSFFNSSPSSIFLLISSCPFPSPIHYHQCHFCVLSWTVEM